MRFGVMLRALDERGGIGVYTNNLVTELLRIDHDNQYLLFFQNPDHLGKFSAHPNVVERLIRAPHKTLWDQIAIPYACRREKTDVVFHPKFTVPLIAPCKSVMVVHGADWFIPEQAVFYNRLDVWYNKIVMPLYFRRSTAVLSVSQLTTDNFNRVLKLEPGKIRTVYLGAGRHFKRVMDSVTLSRIRERYQLPSRFILTLTKQGRGGDLRKNFGRLLQAYARYHRQTPDPIKLVVGGEDCHRFREQYRIPNDEFGRDICFPGWIEQTDLPSVYSAADLYLHPSNLEAFPQPVVEAMSCGTPLIASNVNGIREIAGDAGLLVDPTDTEAIGAAISRVVTDEELKRSLSTRGLRRAKLFTWDRCARETLAILEEVGRSA